MSVAITELHGFVRKKDNLASAYGVWCFIVIYFFLVPAQVQAQDAPVSADTTIIEQDSVITSQDSVRNLGYRRNSRPTFNMRDRFGDPFSNHVSPSPLIPKDPTMLEVVPQLDTTDTTINYSIQEKIGGIDYRAPTKMSFDDYSNIQDNRIRKEYWKGRSSDLDGESAVSGRRLIPPIYTTPVFDRLFGGSFVDIRPNGFVTLDFGGRFQRIDNPSIPIRQQRNGNFEFDQQISLNVTGKIGDKLAVTANFDNNNSFDFQNNVKVEYTGYDHEIIKKIELGNVSLPVSNSLITGSQSLFGLKTQLQFGRLFVTSVASVQRGSSDVVNVGGGGSQQQEFELRASEYDDNRHFFLGHFFRDNYELWLQQLPQILSGLNVTRVEVYVLNRNNTTDALRNVVGFMDLGEGNLANVYRKENPKILPLNTSTTATFNDANALFKNLKGTPGLRDIAQVDNLLTSQYSFENATDYQKVTSSRKLTEQEYTFNSQLGYLSLNRKLSNDEMLAVAFEYTYNGRQFKVGELTEDYQNLPDSAAIFLKLLRPTKINTTVPTWDLMMKNIYSLNASQVSRENFQLRVIYRDDNSGVDNPSLHEGEIKDQPLIRLLGLDRLNQNNDQQPDGNFDFVENITIDPELGTVIFPVLEPFGSKLRSVITEGAPEQELVSKYVYDALYTTTKADAELITTKNKFYLMGSYTAGSASEITLPGFNIAEGSVQVLAGNTPLTEGSDFTVDYTVGKVTILNEGVLNSGKEIQITYEKADLFNFQQRSLFGARLDYKVSENVNFGATILHLNERPLVTRVNIGDEPTKNTKYGFDINYSQDSRFLTRLVDLLPIVQTKEPSTFTFNAEFAQLLPGTSNVVRGDGTSYIDDFENSITPFSLSGWQNWSLASTPRSISEARSLDAGFKRAKIAWYVVDNTAFYLNRGNIKPGNIPKEINNQYERDVIPQEIFPNQSEQVVQTNLPIFDIAYFPEERGPYNYSPSLTEEGRLTNPASNWGGITRAITSEVDFDKTNIEYIEFWMLDPFIGGENGVVRDGVVNQNNTTGGKLVFNLGSVSEDVIPDGRHFFENGLSEDYGSENVAATDFGRVTTQQFLTDFFNNTSAEARANQDIGFDGVRNSEPTGEAAFYKSYIDRMPAGAQQAISADPSADNFQYYLGEDLDAQDAQIVERYKNFNGQEGNTPVINNNNTRYTPSGTQKPDNEDLNRDNTLSDLEEYYAYEVDLRPGQLQIGKNYIVDKVTARDNANATWYLFRIPIRQPQRVEGNIQGFKSIRFIRTYLTGFSQPVVLRMAKFQMVGSQWRRYNADLKEGGLSEYAEDYDPNFTISVVNIEENASPKGTGSPYDLPPNIVRDRDNTSPIERRLNEQSLKLCIENLKDGDARAAYKNMNLDLINYGRIRMFLHAESQVSRDSSVQAFLRLGTDFDQNYYEIELPLEMTPPQLTSKEDIWPVANEIDFSLKDLYTVKAKRNRARVAYDQSYTEKVGKYLVTVRGNPDLSSVQTLMIGIRNPSTPDRAPQSVCIWANELRVGDFDRTSGWAVNARVNTKLADVANITASARHMTYGFGSIQSSISERSREETTAFDVSANVNVEKMLPRKLGLQVPMFISYETLKSVPHFDPKNPDIPLDASLLAFETEDQRSNYLDIVTEQAVRRSLNFTNVRKIKLKEGAPTHFYDLANLSFNYLYSDLESSNFNTATYQQRTIQGGVGYNYTFPQVSIQPFGNMEALGSPWLALIKDFNFSPVPSTFNARADLRRSFVKTLLRGADLTPLGEAFYQKAFTFNRIYDLQWNLTSSLALDYGSQAMSIIDEPEGEINTEEKRTQIIENLKKLGRLKNFDQNVAATYSVPFDKLPLTSWLSADVRYGAGYTWQAGAFNPIDPGNSPSDSLGNTIQNNQDQSLNGRINLTDLYNKVKFLKGINTPTRARPTRPAANRNPADSTANQENAKPPSGAKLLKGIFRVLMSLRSIDVTYTLTNNTLVPGFRPTVSLFGMAPGFGAPGIPFVLGSQDPGVLNDLRDNGYLSTSQSLTMPFQQARLENLGVRANIEPFQDFRIQLDFKKTTTANYQKIITQDSSSVRTGSYSVTYFTLPTAFSDGNSDVSTIFQRFEQNREVIMQRLMTANPNYDGEVRRYNLNSQDVLIPAFMAAYAGQDVNQVKLNPFPKIPLPNWRVDYNGLPKLFGSLGETFQQFALSHAYTSTYSVNNFTSSIQYGITGVGLDQNITNYPFASIPEDSVLVPQYVIQQVTITERFAPLIGINIRTKGRLSGRISYDTERSLALNLSNAQVTELTSKGVTVNFGFTKSKFTLPFRVKGETITLKNDLTFNFAMSLKDTKTIQRKIDEENTVTNGNLNFQFRPTVDYRVNERLNVQLYFARTVNDPRVTNSYKRTTTEFGTQVRFNLAQ